jgi:hypothetical protein
MQGTRMLGYTRARTHARAHASTQLHTHSQCPSPGRYERLQQANTPVTGTRVLPCMYCSRTSITTRTVVALRSARAIVARHRRDITDQRVSSSDVEVQERGLRGLAAVTLRHRVRFVRQLAGLVDRTARAAVAAAACATQHTQPQGPTVTAIVTVMCRRQAINHTPYSRRPSPVRSFSLRSPSPRGIVTAMHIERNRGTSDAREQTLHSSYPQSLTHAHTHTHAHTRTHTRTVRAAVQVGSVAVLVDVVTADLRRWQAGGAGEPRSAHARLLSVPALAHRAGGGASTRRPCNIAP